MGNCPFDGGAERGLGNAVQRGSIGDGVKTRYGAADAIEAEIQEDPDGPWIDRHDFADGHGRQMIRFRHRILLPLAQT